MSGRTILTYAAAIVVGVVVAVVTMGTGLAPYAALIGGIAFSATAAAMQYAQMGSAGAIGIGPASLSHSRANSSRAAAAGQLEIASSSEAVTIPVIFGMVRLGGNFIRYDKSTFHADPIIQTYTTTTPAAVTSTSTPSGGKGGGPSPVETAVNSGSKAGEAKTETIEQIIGYRYRLSFDYGLCMGPVDRFGRVYSSPGEAVVGTGITFSSSAATRQNIALSGIEEGGTIIAYRGHATQTRVSGDVYQSPASGNHRHVAFASFQNFRIGTQPSPKTYLFEVQRFPRCYNSAGAIITGIKTRGSNTTSNASYQDANPAAILYEIFTNGIWGRGLSPDLLDVPSFIAASEYFAAANIGMSFALQSQDVVGDAVENIRTHCSTIVTWNGEKLKCRCMMDRTTAYANPIKLSSENTREVTFSRPAWPDTVNELRCEFTNRANNYQVEIVHAQDLASLNTVGLTNSQRMGLHGFSNRACAEAQATRLLQELSYPTASLSLLINRWNSRIEPGDFVEFVSTEWGIGPITSFWRVAQIDDDDQDGDGIKLTLSEDLYATAYEGAGEPIAPVVPAFEIDISNDDVDLNLGDDNSAPWAVGSLAVITAWEQNPFLSGGDNDIIITAERSTGYVASMLNYWSLESSISYAVHSATTGWAVTGLLATAPPNTGRSLCREVSDWFTITINVAANEATLLGSANKVQLPSDNLQVLAESGTDLLLIGNEVFLCGFIEELSPSIYTVKNYQRAAFGSAAQAHSPGARIAFIPAWRRVNYATGLGSIPVGAPIALRAHALTTKGEDANNNDFFGPEPDHSFVGRGSHPYAPGYVAHTVAALAWTLSLRPRFHDRGADVDADIQTSLNSLVTSLPDAWTTWVQPFNGSTPTGPAESTPHTFTPDDGTNPATGLLALAYTAPAGTNSIRVWAGWAGKLSLEAIEVAA